MGDPAGSRLSPQVPEVAAGDKRSPPLKGWAPICANLAASFSAPRPRRRGVPYGVLRGTAGDQVGPPVTAQGPNASDSPAPLQSPSSACPEKGSFTGSVRRGGRHARTARAHLGSLGVVRRGRTPRSVRLIDFSHKSGHSQTAVRPSKTTQLGITLLHQSLSPIPLWIQSAIASACSSRRSRTRSQRPPERESGDHAKLHSLNPKMSAFENRNLPSRASRRRVDRVLRETARQPSRDR